MRKEIRIRTSSIGARGTLKYGHEGWAFNKTTPEKQTQKK
jgi:hypothetical protein